MRSHFLVISAMVVLAGCLTDRTLRDVPDGERAWRIGYRDGCHSGRSRADLPDRWEKDLPRFRSDDLYRNGWKAGEERCFDEASASARASADEAAAKALADRPAPAGAETTPPAAAAVAVPDARVVPRVTEKDMIRARIRALRDEIERLEGRLEPGDE